jgi:hypothetical protein
VVYFEFLHFVLIGFLLIVERSRKKIMNRNRKSIEGDERYSFMRIDSNRYDPTTREVTNIKLFGDLPKFKKYRDEREEWVENRGETD